MSTLHTINKSLSEAPLWKKLSAAVTHGDAVLCIEDGVYATLDPNALEALSLLEEQRQIKMYVLEDDLRARGLSDTPDAIRPASYSDFVTLCTTHSKVISWHA